MAEPDSSTRSFASMLRAFPSLRRLALGGRRRRLPFVQQTSAADCGAACVAMVLAYHGKELPLDEVRQATGAGREGTDALTILNTAEHFGLRSRGLQVEDLDDLRYLSRGTVLHWGFQHFVILERIDRKGAVIVDPATGRRHVGWDQLDTSFTGVALSFEPSENFRREKRKTAGGMMRYFRQVLAYREMLTPTLVISVMVRLLALATPLVTGVIVDRVVPRSDYDLLTLLLIGVVAVVLFSFLTHIVRAHLLLQLRTHLDVRLALNFLEHLVDLPYSFFQSRSSGDLLMRLNSNTKIRDTLTSSTLSGILDGSLVTLYLLLLLLIEVRIALVVLALGILRVMVFVMVRRRYRDLTAASLQVQAATRNYEVQTLAAIGTLKAMGAERRAVNRWTDLFVKEINVSLAQGRLVAIFESLLWTIGAASPLVVLVYGALQVLHGQMSLGTMLAVSALSAGFLIPLSELVGHTAMRLQQLNSYLERIDDVFNTPREQQGEDVQPAPELQGGVTLDNVSFRYSEASPLVIRDVSLQIEPGEFVAIVGASGAGKTTLAALIMGLYTPSDGRILFDEHDLRSLDLRSVRQQLGIVPQDPYLFGESIRRNIALGDPTVPLHRIIRAARQAHVHADVTSLTMGYDTVLADGGLSLSGGQRQRLALARALVRRPAVLLLDEATSHLDAVTELGIQEELTRLRCTRIVIAHRLSTIRDADLILVLDGGRIVEQGDHETLCRLDGHYARLIENQKERKGKEQTREQIPSPTRGGRRRGLVQQPKRGVGS